MRRRRNPINPEILGNDLEDLAVRAGGLFGTAAGNDQLVAPLAKKFLPFFYADDQMSKGADVITTFVTAWGLGKVIEMIHEPWARPVTQMGAVFGIAKVPTVLTPNFSLSAKTPDVFKKEQKAAVQKAAQSVVLGGQPAGALAAGGAPALPPGGVNVAQLGSTGTSLGTFTTYPRPVGNDQYAGL